MKFKSNLIFVIKLFLFYMTKTSRQKFKYLEREKILKIFVIIFKKLSMKLIIFLEGEGPTLDVLLLSIYDITCTRIIYGTMIFNWSFAAILLKSF